MGAQNLISFRLPAGAMQAGAIFATGFLLSFSWTWHLPPAENMQCCSLREGLLRVSSTPSAHPEETLGPCVQGALVGVVLLVWRSQGSGCRCCCTGWGGAVWEVVAKAVIHQSACVMTK